MMNSAEALARLLHERYEIHATKAGWKTQELCQVPFDDLPEANKTVMLKVAEDLLARATGGLICPHCGSQLLLVGTIHVTESKKDVSAADIKAIFPPGMRQTLEVSFEGNFAKVSMKRLDKKNFRKALSEVKGYGGEYVKGYFKIPTAGVH